MCMTPCGPANPCVGNNYCDQTTMMCRPKKALGTTCAGPDDCASGNCVDGVCCNTACAGTCQQCNQVGQPGHCVPVPSGQDPGMECPAEPSAPCGHVGGCDGAGACKYQPDGTACGTSPTTCSGTTESQRACNGRGQCITSMPRSCVISPGRAPE